MQTATILLRFGILFLAWWCSVAGLAAQVPILGMNVVSPGERSVAEQNATITQLKDAGVRVVRFGVTLDEKNFDFVRRVHAAGIRMDLIVNPQYAAAAPSRAAQPEKFPGMYGGHPLSSADPELSRAYFQKLLDRLDAEGIVPAAFELGNEINWAAFNPEFPLPGEGKIFSYDDLQHDREGQMIARGFDQYIRIAAALRDVRDRSKLSRTTPILSAGLSDAGPARSVPGGKEDAVSINPTIQYLRDHGLDRYVDGYGIHVYLFQPTAQARKTELEDIATRKCGNGAPGQSKPCWITEWGFRNTDESCPVKDDARSALVRETMVNLRALAEQKRLVAAIYFSWDTDAYAKQASPLSVFRCGSLSPSGRLALDLH